MARIRTIKPELPQSESLGRTSREARLCFILLWTQADDAGRLRGNSRMLASLLFPYDDDAKDLIGGWLDELEQEGCIRRYEHDGDHYIDIPKWLDHQKIDHASQSKFPAFDEASRILASPRENSPRTKDQGPKDQGPRTAPVAPLPDPVPGEFEAWYASYPLRKGRGQALKAYRLARKKASLEVLLEGAKRYALEATDPKFIAHPATWLNGERWADEPAKPGERKPMNGSGGGGMVRDSAAYDDMILKTRAEKIARGERLPFRPAPEQIRRMVEQGWLSDVLAKPYLERNGAGEG